MEPKVNDQRELISMLLILFILLGVCQNMDISYMCIFTKYAYILYSLLMG